MSNEEILKMKVSCRACISCMPQIVENVSILACHCEERSDVAIRVP